MLARRQSFPTPWPRSGQRGAREDGVMWTVHACLRGAPHAHIGFAGGLAMNKMVRQQFFMTAEQKKRLKSRAALAGTSLSELIRRSIERELDDKAAEAGAKAKTTTA